MNQYLPVFTILFNGNGSFIENLIINGSTGNAGILINNSSNNTITGNNITGNSNGISLYNSTGNQISENIISNNNMNGITVNDGSENDFLVNTITNNGNIGITINTSNDNLIYSNNIANNTLDGIYLYNSPTKVNFNRIALNSRYGLSNLGNGTLDAQNNWWGSNNPLNSTNICIGGGSVNCAQWLVLNVTTSIDRTNRTNNCYNNIITADLTQNNNGDDTSRNGDTLPDGIPITTTMGTTNTSANTKKADQLR